MGCLLRCGSLIFIAFLNRSSPIDGSESIDFQLDVQILSGL